MSSCSRFFASPYHLGCRVFSLEPEVAAGSAASTLASSDEEGRSQPLDGVPAPRLCRAITNTHTEAVCTTNWHPFLPLVAVGGLDGRLVICRPSLG